MLNLGIASACEIVHLERKLFMFRSDPANTRWLFCKRTVQLLCDQNRCLHHERRIVTVATRRRHRNYCSSVHSSKTYCIVCRVVCVRERGQTALRLCQPQRRVPTKRTVSDLLPHVYTCYVGIDSPPFRFGLASRFKETNQLFLGQRRQRYCFLCCCSTYALLPLCSKTLRPWRQVQVYTHSGSNRLSGTFT